LKETVCIHSRTIEEAFSWGKNFSNLLSEARFERAIKHLCDQNNDREKNRCKQVKQFLFAEAPLIEDFSFCVEDVRQYDPQEREYSIQSNNRLYLRALLGKNFRAEIVNFLFHGKKGNSYEIAECVLAEQSWVYRTLANLENNGLVTSKKDGRQNIYQWQGKLQLANEEEWNNWIEIYDGLLQIFKKVILPETKELTEYQKKYVTDKIKDVFIKKQSRPYVDFLSVSEIPDQFSQLSSLNA